MNSGYMLKTSKFKVNVDIYYCYKLWQITLRIFGGNGDAVGNV